MKNNKIHNLLKGIDIIQSCYDSDGNGNHIHIEEHFVWMDPTDHKLPAEKLKSMGWYQEGNLTPWCFDF